MSLDKTFNSKDQESLIYSEWEDKGLFKPSSEAKGEPFSIIMPPPNANGNLHAGHAVGYTLEDIICRYMRQQGRPVLWQPGTDHAGIETQFVYEKKLASEGKSRFDLGPEKFNEEVMAFTIDNQDNILNQFRSIGFSADWSRLRFTLDDEVVKLVNANFEKMLKEDHIYRGNRITNWCHRCGAAFADIEVDRTDTEDPFYTFQYGPFKIGTARPETKFGDKYVVVHPDDSRYSDYTHGDKFTAEWINGEIEATVIKDDSIDMEFGTGAMTITPWHDAVDFDIAQKYDLDKEQIIDHDGKLLPIAGELAGESITEARPKIVEILKNKGLLVKEEPKVHAVATHDRCGTVIEPQITRQWFMRVGEVNKPVIKAITEDEIKFYPARFKQVALNWLEQEHDWCISRQNWWGIRIPVHFRKGTDDSLDEFIVNKTDDEATEYYGVDGFTKSHDTFDTWFSSSQWPYATLKTGEPGDYDKFYPTSLMATAREILHKWVTRMIMFGLYDNGQIPFESVYLWGLVTDEKGAKMSKSKGNVLDPLELTAKYGTDALRLTAALTNTPGNDSPLSESKVEPQRNFCNKLWNIAKFAEMTFDKEQPQDMSVADHWILSRLEETKTTIQEKFKTYRLNEAAYHVYHFIWDDLADWYIEASKTAPNPELLMQIITDSLIICHPFIPFITEQIWKDLELGGGMLAEQQWPDVREFDTAKAETMRQLLEVAVELRKTKSELNQNLTISVGNIGAGESALLAGLTNSKLVDDNGDLHLASLEAKLEPSSDLQKQLGGLDAKKIESLKSDIKALESRLGNKGYTDKAPQHMVDETKAQLDEKKQQLAELAQ